MEIQWKLAGERPVIAPDTLHPPFDANRAGACHVLRLEDRYRMYYWGTGGRGHVILMAESPVDSPNAWTPTGSVLLERQPETHHNFGGPSFPFVLPLDSRRWLMFFGAWGKPRADGKLPNTTNVALSDDAGLTWRYHEGNPVLPLDQPYDSEGTGSVWVCRDGDELRMYYTAIGPYSQKPDGVRTGHGDVIPRIGIGYAVSRDGLHWEKPLDDLLIAPRGFDADPYEYINSKPCVVRDGSGWRMWISTFGHAYRIRSLTSHDGRDWTRVPSGPDGDLGIGGEGGFDDHQRCYASVIVDGDTYHLWYTGNGFGTTGMGYATGRSDR